MKYLLFLLQMSGTLGQSISPPSRPRMPINPCDCIDQSMGCTSASGVDVRYYRTTFGEEYICGCNIVSIWSGFTCFVYGGHDGCPSNSKPTSKGLAYRSCNQQNPNGPQEAPNWFNGPTTPKTQLAVAWVITLFFFLLYGLPAAFDLACNQNLTEDWRPAVWAIFLVVCCLFGLPFLICLTVWIVLMNQPPPSRLTGKGVGLTYPLMTGYPQKNVWMRFFAQHFWNGITIVEAIGLSSTLVNM